MQIQIIWFGKCYYLVFCWFDLSFLRGLACYPVLVLQVQPWFNTGHTNWVIIRNAFSPPPSHFLPTLSFVLTCPTHLLYYWLQCQLMLRQQFHVFQFDSLGRNHYKSNPLSLTFQSRHWHICSLHPPSWPVVLHFKHYSPYKFICKQTSRLLKSNVEFTLYITNQLVEIISCWLEYSHNAMVRPKAQFVNHLLGSIGPAVLLLPLVWWAFNAFKMCVLRSISTIFTQFHAGFTTWEEVMIVISVVQPHISKPVKKCLWKGADSNNRMIWSCKQSHLLLKTHCIYNSHHWLLHRSFENFCSSS